MDDVTPARAAACPRCGYDLRGTVAGWTGSCPLSGTCAECGLRFEWALLLNPLLDRPRWCVEYATGPFSFLRRTAATLLRTAWPWAFWRRLRMTDEIRWPRLAAYVAALAALLYLCFAAAHTVLAYGVVGGTRWRLFISGRAGPLAVVGWDDCILAGLAPLSGSPIGGATLSSYDLLASYWAPVFLTAAGILLVHALCAAGFLALPISRRIAKVRYAHIHRIAAYGLALPALLIALQLAGIALSQQGSAQLAGIGDALNAALGLGLLALLGAEIVWWSVATERYLRLRHAWAVGAAVVVMACLAAGTVPLWLVVLLG